MYRDKFLKFESQEQAEELLFDIVDDFKRPKFINTDVIGDIYRPTGNVVDGIPEQEKLDGYHVNVRVTDEDVSSLEPFEVQPKQPYRLWA